MIADVGAYLVFFLVVALYYALVCLGLNLQWGVTGPLQRRRGGLRGRRGLRLGAPDGPDSPDHWGGLGLPVAVGWAGAAAPGRARALLVGAVTLRLRHDYLAIATFGIAVTIQLVALNFVRLTNGPFGIVADPAPLAGLVRDAGRPERPLPRAGRRSWWPSTYVLLERLVRSPWGRVLRGLREDEVGGRRPRQEPRRATASRRSCWAP